MLNKLKNILKIEYRFDKEFKEVEKSLNLIKLAIENSILVCDTVILSADSEDFKSELYTTLFDLKKTLNHTASMWFYTIKKMKKLQMTSKNDSTKKVIKQIFEIGKLEKFTIEKFNPLPNIAAADLNIKSTKNLKDTYLTPRLELINKILQIIKSQD